MKIAIIGAGVIGVSTGLQLAVRGHDVTIFDREGVASATSQGNAGAFAFTDVAPLATPGVMRKAPKWLLDPLGPLSIPPAYALNIAHWLLRFWRASWPDRYEAALAAQVSLMTQSRNALERLAKDHGMEAFSAARASCSSMRARRSSRPRNRNGASASVTACASVS